VTAGAGDSRKARHDNSHDNSQENMVNIRRMSHEEIVNTRRTCLEHIAEYAVTDARRMCRSVL